MRNIVAAIATIALIASAGLASAEEPGAAVMKHWGCLGCHSVAGQGGELAPSLDDVIKRRGEKWVREKISNPRGMNPSTIMPTLGLRDSEIDAIIDYLTSTGSVASLERDM
jgi:cytochrome c2